jgi:phenylpropionate dioxygenase-like ring-hydroxylating dioxygenase large terminal subunit
VLDVYTGSDTFKQESQNIFEKKWVFYGVSNFFKEKNDFLARKIGNINVVVLGDGANNFTCVENICPHRGAMFVKEGFGNGKLICPFHYWAFSNNGDLLGIPYEDKLFLFDENQKNNIKLKEYRVELVGKFIFVNLSDAPRPIEEQVARELLDQLIEISKSMDESYTYTNIKSTANWKLLVEIVMDELHVPFVHSKTFAKIRSYIPGDYSDKKIEYKFSRDIDISISTQVNYPLPKEEAWHDKVQSSLDKNIYYDFFIFPNLHFFSSNGLTFSYSAFYPQETSTIIDYYFSTAKKTKTSELFKIVHYESIKYGLNVYSEDIAAVENLQNAAKLGVKITCNYGRYEHWIKAWREYFEEEVYLND